MKTILAAIDFSDVTEHLVEVARDMARAHGAALHLLHVEESEPDFVGYEPGPQHVRDQVAHEAVRHFKEENSLRDQLRAEGIDAHSMVLQGPRGESAGRSGQALGRPGCGRLPRAWRGVSPPAGKCGLKELSRGRSVRFWSCPRRKKPEIVPIRDCRSEL